MVQLFYSPFYISIIIHCKPVGVSTKDSIDLIISIGTFILGAFIFIKGISEYKKSNQTKRAEFLETLITMFNNEKIRAAKQILDDYVWPDEIRINELSEKKYDELESVNLTKTLRNHSD